MKILFDHHLPFALAYGGVQVQIEQTKAAVERAGVATDHVKWWKWSDGGQGGDLIHFFDVASHEYLERARVSRSR